MKYTYIFYFLLFFLCTKPIFSQNTNKKEEAKPLIKIFIVTNKNNSWNCLSSISSFKNLSLKKCNLNIKVFICGEDSEIKKQYNLDYELYLDPFCLYSEKFNFKYLPGISIYDDKNELVLQEDWNPSKQNNYKKLILKIDENAETIVAKKIKGLKFLETISLKNEDEEIINGISFKNSGAICKNQYYIFDKQNNQIQNFSSNGKLKNIIKIPCENIDCQAPFLLNILDDLTLQLVNYSTNSVDFHLINTNNNKFIKHLSFPYLEFSDTSTLNHTLVKLEDKYIASRYFYDNCAIESNNSILLLLDSNFNIIKKFGKAEPIFKKNKMAYFTSSYIKTARDESQNIYSLFPSSNNLYKFDKNGNYEKTIILEFDSTYKITYKNYEKKIARDEIFEYFLNNNIPENIEIKNYENEIILVHSVKQSNKNNTEVLQFYINRFDISGKRINENSIILPLDWEVVYKKDNKIVLRDRKITQMVFHWYEFE